MYHRCFGTILLKSESVARILLVENEPVVRRLFTTLLSADGFELLSTGSVTEAKKLMSEKTFDLVVSDYSLSDGNADRSLRLDQENQPRFTNRFILTTGWPEKDGFPIILEKPFHIKDLEALILRVLGE